MWRRARRWRRRLPGSGARFSSLSGWVCMTTSLSLEGIRYSLSNSIAVIGVAGRFPGARNIYEFWNNLRSGKESATTLTTEELTAAGVSPKLCGDPNYVKVAMKLEDIDCFDATFFGYNTRQATYID